MKIKYADDIAICTRNLSCFPTRLCEGGTLLVDTRWTFFLVERCLPVLLAEAKILVTALSTWSASPAIAAICQSVMTGSS